MSNSVKVSTEMDFDDLMDKCWSGATDTLEEISNAGLEDELMDVLVESSESSDGWDMGELNDFLWFESDYIAERLGFRDFEALMNGDDSEDEDEDEDDEEDMDESRRRRSAKRRLERRARPSRRRLERRARPTIRRKR